MKRSSARSRAQTPRLLRVMSVVALALLVVVWALERFIAERHGLTAALTYIPQQPLLAPSALLLALSMARRDGRSILLNFVALAIAAVALLDFRLALPARSPHVRSVRVMTWNIHGGKNGIAGIASEILAADADIVCLQEAVPRPRQAAAPPLDDLLPGYQIARTGDVLIASRLPLTETWILRFNDEGIWRTALQADVRASGQTLSVVNVHYLTFRLKDQAGAESLSSVRRWQATADVRMKQAHATAEWLADIPGPLILAGDFNTPPRGHAYRTLSTRLHGAFDKTGIGFGYTFPARLPAIRIDHIFTGQGATPVSARVLPTTLSDHLPVLTEIALPTRQ